MVNENICVYTHTGSCVCHLHVWALAGNPLELVGIAQSRHACAASLQPLARVA